MLKGLQEKIRFCRITADAHSKIVTNIMFLRQLTTALLKDTTETDRLCDALSAALASRYEDPGSGPGWVNQTSTSSRVVADAMYSLGRECMLLQR